MDEQQAKYILDFLAKKAGGLEVVLSDFHVYVKVLDPDKRLPIDQIKYYKEALNGNKDGHYEAILEQTFKGALDRMLYLAGSGYDIKCGNYRDTRVFMRRGTTLEQVLVEVDLVHV